MDGLEVEDKKVRMKGKQWAELEGRASFDAACRVTHPEVIGVSSPGLTKER